MKEISLNLPSPIEKLSEFNGNYEVYVKREDLIHKNFGGNKWRKLIYNIQNFYTDSYKTIVTFGGAFSNHIAATSAACAMYEIPVVGIIRGSYVDQRNPTLSKAKALGMKIHHVRKDQYITKENNKAINEIISSYENPLVIPEGGNNEAGIRGMKDLVNEIENYDTKFDVIAVSAGTGATSLGIIRYINKQTSVKIINALKNKSLNNIIANRVIGDLSHWQVLEDYNFGGFAKVTDSLQAFTQKFYDQYKIELDPVYNSKMFYAMYDLMSKELIDIDSKILLINTGGHQGIGAYNYVNKRPWIKK